MYVASAEHSENIYILFIRKPQNTISNKPLKMSNKNFLVQLDKSLIHTISSLCNWIMPNINQTCLHIIHSAHDNNYEFIEEKRLNNTRIHYRKFVTHSKQKASSRNSRPLLLTDPLQLQHFYNKIAIHKECKYTSNIYITFL